MINADEKLHTLCFVLLFLKALMLMGLRISSRCFGAAKRCQRMSKVPFRDLKPESASQEAKRLKGLWTKSTRLCSDYE